MNNELKIFENKEFGQVRVLTIDNEPWFVGKDIAERLGYERTDNAIRTHIDDEDKLTHQISASGQKRNMILINESGLYSLILSSKLPKSREFKRWVTSEVLPSIRKTGEYQTPKKKQEKLSSINNAARTILPVLEKAGMKPEYQVYMLNQLYGKVGLEIPMERVEQEQRLYDKTAIAKKLGVLSKNGNPHAQAIGAIISKVDIEDDERELTSFERNGHVGTEYQYKESVIFKIQNWLEDNSYPSVISKDGKTYKVSYTIEVEVA